MNNCMNALHERFGSSWSASVCNFFVREMAAPNRYCKRCKGIFASDACPGGHPNFMYVKEIPADATYAVAKSSSEPCNLPSGVAPDDPLMAAHRGNVGEMARLLKLGVDPDDPIFYGKKYKGGTPLQYAATGGHAEILRLLLQEGKAQVSKQNTHDGSSALHYACNPPAVGEPFRDCVAVLLEFGADTSCKDAKGRTPKETIIGEHPEVVAMLRAA
jgi:hypothetical protein